MQKKNAGIARNFALKGLLLLAALTLSTGFFACKVAVGSGDGVGTEVPQVTLTFDAGEGSFKDGKTLTLTGKAGEAFTLPESPVRKGYDLKGWKPALPEKYPEKNTEYTAEWVKEGDYTITYELNGGTNAPENPESYNVESETIILKDPVKTGYTFEGWYKDVEFTDKIAEITQGSNGNITLYAKWELESYTITYELDGGTNAPENPASYNVETETITLKDPVKPGYTFGGWYIAEDFTGNAVTEIPQGSTGNITFYAKWLENYTITYALDGGTNAEENPAGYNVETETITLKDPVKTGYTFEGWYKDVEFTDKIAEITQDTTGNITLYAKWELVSYTITYVNVDGATNENPPSYNVETGTITLKDLVKTGYTFAGWYTAGNSPVTKIKNGSTGNITLYAKWVTDIEGKVFVRGGDATLNSRKVTLSSFWISPYEVTQEEFESLMAGNTNGIEPNPSYFPDNPAAGEVQERRPVEQVSWYDAIVYCNLLSIKEGLTPCYAIKGSTTPADWGTSPTSDSTDDYADWESVTCNFDADGYRLPTEAEWEYAARGGKTGITDGSWNNTYSGSNTADDVAWYNSNSDSKTHEVGKKQSNSLGLYDMCGNVWEWCWDWYGMSSYPSGTEDPAGPDTGIRRILHGGCWDDFTSSCPVSNRGSYYPCTRRDYYGFRLVRSAR